VRAASSALTFRHLTSASNGRYGVFRSGGFATTVTNAIVRGNGAANFSGVNLPDVNYTCGLVGGGTGNFDADPLFVDAPGGDLRLQTSSPCVDVAEPVTSFGIVKDHAENSRLSDGQLIGLPYPDLGAYEANPFVLEVDGSPWSGETVTLTVHGPPAAVAIALGTLSGVEFAIPWGFSLADPIGLLQPLLLTFSETPAAIVMPDLSAFANVPFGLQALAVPLSAPTLAVFTNLYRGVLDG
jgi:hypothetical protein